MIEKRCAQIMRESPFISLRCQIWQPTAEIGTLIDQFL